MYYIFQHFGDLRLHGQQATDNLIQGRPFVLTAAIKIATHLTAITLHIILYSFGVYLLSHIVLYITLRRTSAKTRQYLRMILAKSMLPQWPLNERQRFELVGKVEGYFRRNRTSTTMFWLVAAILAR